jgi:23S rRNA (cytosine1962-C5)-methyltransferase
MLAGEDRRLRRGHPWAFANELALDEATRALRPGSVVDLADARGAPLGTATLNLHSLIAARVYDPGAGTSLDAAWFARRLRPALALRAKLCPPDFHRLIHAEGDGLPGTVVDRFGACLVVQANTAGAERLIEPLIEALESELRPEAIVLRNDSPARALEGLAPEVRLARGQLRGPVELREGPCRFLVDPLGGQKTGWFFDLTEARSTMARLAGGGRVLDLYCHTGGFALRAAQAGATDVLAVDRSAPALALARASAGLNERSSAVRFQQGEAFEELAALTRAGERFDCVIADPPSFVKSRRELAPGLQGYRKLTRLAAACVGAGGFLFVASCSHHVPAERFAQAVAEGLISAGRRGRVLIEAGAGPDHPTHPLLPETAYLKYRVLQLD